MKFARLSLPSLPVLAVLAVMALLGLQGAVEYWLMAPLKADTVKLTQEVTSLRMQQPSGSPLQSKTEARFGQILEHLEGPRITRIRVERLHALADQNNVVMRKASYRNASTPGDIDHQELQIELAGAYPSIRLFLRAVLEEDSAAAIESLEFSRPSGSGGVRAQVRMALYFRKTTLGPDA